MLADTQTAESPRRTGAARWFVPAVVLLVLVLWASAFIAIRSAAHSLSPGPIALLRLLVGTLVVGGLAARRREPLPRGRPLVLLVIYGLAWFGGYNVALNAAERHLDPGTSAMLVNVAPVLIALAAGAFLGEGFPRQLLIGMTVAFGGVVVISLGEGGRHGDGAGVGLALAAAVLYGVGVLSQKVALRSTAPLQATWIGCLTATLALMPFAPQAAAELAQARPQDVLLTVYLGVFPTAAGFVLWSYALSRTRAGALSSTTLAVPAIAVLLSWLILGELPTLAAGVGGAICLIGVAVASRRPGGGRVTPAARTLRRGRTRPFRG